MQKPYYSKEEKLGWMLISIIPLGIVIGLLGIFLGNYLPYLGISQKLSNNILDIIGGTGGIIMLLGLISCPIGIVKVIKALRLQKKLSNKNINFEKNKENSTEDSQVKRIKKLMVGIPLIYVLLTIITSIIVNEEYIRLSNLIIGLLCLLNFITLLIYIVNFRKQKEKEGKLYTISLDLAYEGEIKDGKADGKGIAYYYDGTKKYEGTFKDGKLNGKGITYYTDGKIRYKGSLKNGLANGKGTVYYQNGNIITQGNFKNDKLEGKGICYYNDGKISLNGNFRNGNLCGKGIWYYENGEIHYEGLFKNWNLEGKGVLYYDNGNKHQEGIFKNGKLEGFGKIFYKSGDLLYEGEFKGGLPHGEGTMYDANGYEIYKGKFRKGKIWNLTKRFQILLYKLIFWKN